MTVCPAIGSVAERAAPLFAAMAIVTVPLPLPLPPDAIEIHETLLAAVHPHAPELVTETDVAVEPPAATEIVSGATVYAHATVAATWFTGTVLSPIVNSPLRAAPVLDATLNVTVPLPVVVVRPVSEIHVESELADHSHDEAAVTEIELLFVPDAGNVTSLGETVTLQVVVVGGGTGALACCVTVAVWPATTIDAERVVVPAFDPIV